MGVGYKLPLTYNVIKTTLKSTNHEAGKKMLQLLSLDIFFMLQQIPNEKKLEPGQKLLIHDRPGSIFMRLPEKISWLRHCTVKYNQRRRTY